MIQRRALAFSVSWVVVSERTTCKSYSTRHNDMLNPKYTMEETAGYYQLKRR